MTRLPRAGAGPFRIGLLAALVPTLLACWTAGPAVAGGLTPEEEIGRRIYFEGQGAGPPIVTLFGRDDQRIPAILLPCANCHGHDGLGRPEGGVEPPAVTWSHLTKSYGHRHPNGREHGPFDEDSVIGAIAGGTDPDGNALDPLMPRYDMGPDDFKALVAFLKRLETQLDPGLGDSTIRIGTLLPRAGPYAALGGAVEATINGYFDDINATGGIYGRKLELVVAEYANDPAATVANAHRLAEEDGGVFAVLSDFTLGVEKDVFAVFEDAGIPQIDPFTLFAGHGDFPAEHTFFVLSGLPDQARALVTYAARHVDPAPRTLAVVIPPTDIYDDVARVVRDQAQRDGLAAPAVLRLSGDDRGIVQAVTELSRSGSEALLFFGDATVLERIAKEAVARNWSPRLLLPGQTAGRGVFAFPKSFDGRIHLAYPNLPEDQSARGRAEFQKLHAKHNLSQAHLASQVRAFAAAKVLIEGLRRAGRSLDRDGLVREIEGLSKFDTGQLPAISFAANRRVGARGAHVLTVDLAGGRFRPEDVWVDID